VIQPLFLHRRPKTMTDTALKVRLHVEGVDCASCAMKIENALRHVEGIDDVAVSVPAGTVTIVHDGTADGEDFRDRIATPPCCTGASPTFPPWWTCRSGRWPTSGRTSRLHSVLR
jgi:copper chaperone CopZ